MYALFSFFLFNDMYVLFSLVCLFTVETLVFIRHIDFPHVYYLYTFYQNRFARLL